LNYLIEKIKNNSHCPLFIICQLPRELDTYGRRYPYNRHDTEITGASTKLARQRLTTLLSLGRTRLR